MHTRLAIIGGGPAAHTAAIYAGRAELEPILFEGWMAAGIAPGGQLTTTSFVENFPGFVEPIMGYELTDKFRAQSVRYGTRIFTETVTSIDLLVNSPAGHRSAPPGLYGAGSGVNSRSSMEDVSEPAAAAREHKPFVLHTPERVVTADAVIIATGASAKRLRFPGSGDESEGGFWNRGISACAICDGSSPLIRNKPVAVIGGGDSAMEEAVFLTKYASKVYVIHRFNYLEASKAMARRVLANPKIEVLWCTEVKEAHGNEQGNLGSITVARSLTPAGTVVSSGLVPGMNPVMAAPAASADGKPLPTTLEQLEVNGLFFAIGHKPATEVFKGQVDLDEYGYILCAPGTCATSVPGVFAAGDVMDYKYRQAIVAAGHGCMAALEAERYLQAMEGGASSVAAAGMASDLVHTPTQSYSETATAPVGAGAGRGQPTARFEIGSNAADLDPERVGSGGA
ncbi:hypothetical protein HYH02_013247 [Chlamydomonas schloesseri]|uniref:FAD/NAD(P)-binding domain-containing protein n=1 Tax=Chlamydomonas schloesseri TaxID=2026947 RepID=A0A835T399_9CHLO|nr:hypothetical protein HYH02_013247 [Chlamydomonas schloesseri]|eukprot:KAG2431670.1 hypothetical protein HYH02_013247 [Chlamydomonas schloesseri]